MDVVTKVDKFNEEELAEWTEFEAALTKAYTITKVNRKFTDEEIEEWETRCNCDPVNDALMCAACLERNRHKYGDSIPYGGE